MSVWSRSTAPANDPRKADLGRVVHLEGQVEAVSGSHYKEVALNNTRAERGSRLRREHDELARKVACLKEVINVVEGREHHTRGTVHGVEERRSEMDQAFSKVYKAIFGTREITQKAFDRHGSILDILDSHWEGLKDNAQEITDVSTSLRTEREMLDVKIDKLDTASGASANRFESLLLAQAHELSAVEAQCAGLRRRVGNVETQANTIGTLLSDARTTIKNLEARNHPDITFEAEVVEKEDTVAHELWSFKVQTIDCKDKTTYRYVVAADAEKAAKRMHDFINSNCTCEPRILGIWRTHQVDISSQK